MDRHQRFRPSPAAAAGSHRSRRTPQQPSTGAAPQFHAAVPAVPQFHQTADPQTRGHHSTAAFGAGPSPPTRRTRRGPRTPTPPAAGAAFGHGQQQYGGFEFPAAPIGASGAAAVHGPDPELSPLTLTAHLTEDYPADTASWHHVTNSAVDAHNEMHPHHQRGRFDEDGNECVTEIHLSSPAVDRPFARPAHHPSRPPSMSVEEFSSHLGGATAVPTSDAYSHQQYGHQQQHAAGRNSPASYGLGSSFSALEKAYVGGKIKSGGSTAAANQAPGAGGGRARAKRGGARTFGAGLPFKKKSQLDEDAPTMAAAEDDAAAVAAGGARHLGTFVSSTSKNKRLKKKSGGGKMMGQQVPGAGSALVGIASATEIHDDELGLLAASGHHGYGHHQGPQAQVHNVPQHGVSTYHHGEGVIGFSDVTDYSDEDGGCDAVLIFEETDDSDDPDTIELTNMPSQFAVQTTQPMTRKQRRRRKKNAAGIGAESPALKPRGAPVAFAPTLLVLPHSQAVEDETETLLELWQM